MKCRRAACTRRELRVTKRAPNTPMAPLMTTMMGSSQARAHSRPSTRALLASSCVNSLRREPAMGLPAILHQRTKRRHGQAVLCGPQAWEGACLASQNAAPARLPATSRFRASTAAQLPTSAR